MKKIQLFSFMIVFFCLICSNFPVNAQEKFPIRPIHLIVPMPAGGGTDKVARAFSEAIKNYLPQPVLVENIPGAGSVLGMSKLHASKPDGYTLGVLSGYVITTALQGMTKFPPNDFTFLAKISQDTFTLSVPADSKYKTFMDIIEAAKANPDVVTLANAGTGALTHLASVALNQNSGAVFRLVPFVGGAKELTALLGGHVASGVFSMSEVIGHSQPGGKIRTLAVFSEKRHPKLPDVPTLLEFGIKGIPEGPWQGIGAPKGLPEEIKNILIDAIRKAVQDPYWKDFLNKFGYVEKFLVEKEFEEFFQKDLKMLESLMKTVGIIK